MRAVSLGLVYQVYRSSFPWVLFTRSMGAVFPGSCLPGLWGQFSLGLVYQVYRGSFPWDLCTYQVYRGSFPWDLCTYQVYGGSFPWVFVRVIFARSWPIAACKDEHEQGDACYRIDEWMDGKRSVDTGLWGQERREGKEWGEDRNSPQLVRLLSLTVHWTLDTIGPYKWLSSQLT